MPSSKKGFRGAGKTLQKKKKRWPEWLLLTAAIVDEGFPWSLKGVAVIWPDLIRPGP